NKRWTTPFHRLTYQTKLMKKTLILFAALMLAYATSQAQTEKGTQTIGLGIDYFHENNKGTAIDPNTALSQTTRSSTFSFGPQYSIFIANKLDLGASFSYENATYTYPTSFSLVKQVSNTYGGSIYLRKYLMFNDKIGLRTGPYLSYSYENQTN